MTGTKYGDWDRWKELASEGKIADAIVEYVRCYDWVTLVEIQHKLEPYFPTKGDCAMSKGQHLVLWGGMSESFIAVLRQLIDEGRVFLHPTVLLTYLLDGGFCKLPIVKRIPKGGLKSDRWLPVCLRLVPLAEKRRRAKTTVGKVA